MIPERYASYEKNVSVGAVNFTSIPGDKAANLAKIEANVREAAAQGVNIVAFPEEALIGCGGCDVCSTGAAHCDYHDSLAETVPGPSTERIAELARELDIYVVFGLAERDAADPSVLYNAAAVVGPEGFQGTYRKLHLGSLPWVTEGVTFATGSSLPVFETRFGPIGVIICYDFWFNPELTRLLALKGARLILNCCATFAGPAFPRFSHVYAEAGDGEELVTATLSFEKLHRWESIFPWRDWRADHQSVTSRLIADEFRKLAL